MALHLDAVGEDVQHAHVPEVDRAEALVELEQERGVDALRSVLQPERSAARVAGAAVDQAAQPA